jgi:hypothetical protein
MKAIGKLVYTNLELPFYLLLLTFILSSIGRAAVHLNVQGPQGSGSFGSSIVTLPNGNVVVTDPGYDSPTTAGVGAVYLYNGASAQLISVIVGDNELDSIGNFGVTVLANGNYLIISPNWHGNKGAVSFCNRSTGCSGSVSSANSLIGLVGGTPGDRVGSFRATVLSNGNYVVPSPNWGGQSGAVTWGNGTVGVLGEVSASNSLVGTSPGDRIGTGINGTNGVSPLSNGNYVVISSSWSNNIGAATFCNGGSACSGMISSANSLVGTSPGDSVGLGGIQELTNGNVVIRSPFWSDGVNSDVGAVTWASGTSGVTGVVSATNSLVGSTHNEAVGFITPLTNGNYVVLGARGATFGNGSMGVTGVVSATNSLVGNNFSFSRVVALTTGNYVVVCPNWNNGSISGAGSVTLGNGISGTVGTISPSNSLVGDGINGSVGSDGVVPLANGNYVVRSSFWNSSRGAVTFGNGSTGITGSISLANSLVGSTSGDRVGFDGVTALSNGNYVISSASWDNGQAFDAGALTFANGTTGIAGEISAANSLIGTHASDHVGQNSALALPSGNYVAGNPDWNAKRGAALFGNGTTGTFGSVSDSNSLVGSNINDNVGEVINILTNGNYVVVSHQWAGGRGAVSLGNALSGIVGEVSSSNSLTGSSTNDNVGGGNNFAGVIPLSDGNFVVSSPNWSGNFGAVTWVNGTIGLIDSVSPSNSVVGSTASDLISNGAVGRPGVTAFSSGHYAVFSPVWDNATVSNAGAVTLGRPGTPIAGQVSIHNSVLGTQASLGTTLVFAYDAVNSQYVVGEPHANIVTFFRYSSPFDFDGDGKTDISIFRPNGATGGEWWYQRSSDLQVSAFQFGSSTERIVPGDFTGDGKADLAFFRPSTSQWFVMRSEDGTFFAFPFGTTGDIPAPADYDGDGKMDAAIFRPSNNLWVILKSSDGQAIFVTFGASGDQPVPADYDGDGKADIAVFRPSGFTPGAAEWWILRSSNQSVLALQFGSSTEKAVPGDWTGDGKADVAFYRPSTGSWFVMRSEDFSFFSFPFGTTGDIPSPGDYDGDGKFDAAVFRPTGSTWFINRSGGGQTIQQFGLSSDTPVPNAYVRP